METNETSFKGMLAQTTQQQQQQHLKCPRCDSSNTKFCYYNNYSLSQPRHFCKSCKRYWTRGGTLRNVPVGGGCRKIKRLKRPATTSFDTFSNENYSFSTVTTTCATNPNPNSTSPYMNPLFYGLTNVGSYRNRFSNSKVSNWGINSDLVAGRGYGGLSPLGLGFSQLNFSSSMAAVPTYRAQTQQKFGTNNQDLQVGGNNRSATVNNTAIEMVNREGFFGNYNQDNHQMMDEYIGLSSSSTSTISGLDPTDNSIYSNWNGAWLDPSNYMGSSLTSLM